MTVTLKEFAGGAAATTLSSGIANNVLSLSVADGSTFPTGSTAPFVIVVGRGTTSEEKILVTSRSGNSFILATRGYDGSAAAAHSGGDAVEHCLDAITVTDLMSHVFDTTLDNHTQYVKTTGTRQVTISFGTTTAHYPLTVNDAASNTLIAVKKGAAGGATLGSLYIPGGDIINVRNIQGGFTGYGYNLDLGAGSATGGQRGNLSFNYDVGRGVEIWDGSGTAFTSDTVPGGLVAKFNRTTDNTNGEGTIKFYKALSVFGTALFQATNNTAFNVKNAAGTDYFNVNTTSGFVEAPDGAVLRTYSDAYGTVTFQVNGATGAINIYGDVTYAEAKNIGFGTTTGTKIGTGSTQKIGFWGKTPVVQQSRPTDITSVIALLVATGLSA